MNLSPRVRFGRMVGALACAALLGACGAPSGEEPMVEGIADLREADTSAVTVTLSADKAAFAVSDRASLTVTMRNEGAHAVRLLRWYTPAEGLEEPLFSVTRDGEAVAFVGPHYKRPAPTEADYVRLAPGESLVRSVDLAEVYDLSRTGQYEVRFEVAALNLNAAGPKALGLARSNAVGLWVEGRASGADALEREVAAQVTSNVSFTGRCDTTQQNTLLQALSAASTYSNNAVSYLSATPSATPRYTTWFGAFSTSGWNTAKTHFVAIADAFETKAVTLDCKCKQSYYAYVYPTQPYKIYVCRAFWNAPMTGTDSKAGTLVHEMSHFNVVAGTDDHAYGQSAAKNLALSNPSLALDNADSHEYFAENTPFQN
jgi:peptidyl-Lys metalloendopeptidase